MVEFKFECYDDSDPSDIKPTLKPEDCGDIRFRKLLTQAQWLALPKAVRHRFGLRVKQGDSHIYTGHVRYTRINRAGRVLAHALRAFGAPLPLDPNNAGIAATVTVTEDKDGNGQFWTRQYGRPHGFPQVIHSSKRFTGPTGLEEHIGHGVGMTLRLLVEDGALIFTSDQYFVTLLGRRFYLPHWMTPGALRVGHEDRAEEGFDFSLAITHPIFGPLLDQRILFRDVEI